MSTSQASPVISSRDTATSSTSLQRPATPPTTVRTRYARATPGAILSVAALPLAAIGIPLPEVTEKLLSDGLASFQKSFDTLIAGLERKASALGRELVRSQ